MDNIRIGDMIQKQNGELYIVDKIFYSTETLICHPDYQEDIVEKISFRDVWRILDPMTGEIYWTKGDNNG